MRNQFEQKLQELNSDIIKMGHMIETAISKAITALKTRDVKLAQEVIDSDINVDDLEVVIERKSLMILLSEQPVAKDLRAISTALKMITDMERICDQSADIAEIVVTIGDVNELPYPEDIITMAKKCILMVSRSIESFMDNDLELAIEVIKSDDEVDELFDNVRNELVDLIKTNECKAKYALDFLMIAKYLERIGDHATNIAGWVEFNITGKHKQQRVL